MELTLEYETEAFRAWTETFLDKLSKEGGRTFLRNMAFRFLEGVIPKTPVDSGRARGGWASYLIANGQPITGGPDMAAFAEGVSQGRFLEDFTGSEQSIAIINGVRYIVLLEFGSSRQAPSGMVRVTFREIQARNLTNELSDQLMKTVEQANRTARARRRRTLPG